MLTLLYSSSVDEVVSTTTYTTLCSLLVEKVVLQRCLISVPPLFQSKMDKLETIQ
jgi:hypothetical protein